MNQKEIKLQKDLRDFIVWMKYAQYRPEDERRETFGEIIERTTECLVDKAPELTIPIHAVMRHVREGNILPSMRMLHFAGEGISQNNARVYNCSATRIETTKDVADVMFLLLSGCGVGVGLEGASFLREVTEPTGQVFYYPIPDSIEGWAESFQILLDAWIDGETVEFDYSQIRPKGAVIKSINAIAPGPAGLQRAHEQCVELLNGKISLGSTNLIRFLCIMASAVMSGGIRRSALIGIIDEQDKESIALKQNPTWFDEEPYLQYMNISIAWRHPVPPKKSTFVDTYKAALVYGEPGFYNFGQPEYLTNPCGEISLLSKQMCNLVEVNATKLTPENQDELFSAATLLGFVQSRFTDFKFISPEWKKIVERDRLVGVSLTGIAGMRGDVDLERGSDTVKEVLDTLNRHYGEGVKVPRWTTVKPAGHTSLLFNTSSGIHSYPAPYYLRRITVSADSTLGKYLKNVLPEVFLENSSWEEGTYKLVMPLRAPEGAPCQTDPDEAFEMIDRITEINRSWIDRKVNGVSNNISATVTIPEGDEDAVITRLYNGTGIHHKGVTVMSAGHDFDQPVWEPISEERYGELIEKWPMFLGTELLFENRNNTNLTGEAACTAGGCTVT